MMHTGGPWAVDIVIPTNIECLVGPGHEALCEAASGQKRNSYGNRRYYQPLTTHADLLTPLPPRTGHRRRRPMSPRRRQLVATEAPQRGPGLADDHHLQDSRTMQSRHSTDERNFPSRRALEELDEGSDHYVVSPLLSPYAFLNTAEDLLQGPRAWSQSSTSGGRHQVQYSADAPSPSATTTAGPYAHRPGSRRVKSTSNIAEATLAGEDDFHLFAQATAGLGAEQGSRSADTSLGSQQPHRTSLNTYYESTPPSTDHLLSPEQATPTTVRAIQQLAGLPTVTYPYEQQSARPQRPATHRLEATASNFDLWLQLPDAMEPGDSADDELPDYAASQAQAQIAQRVEATRRAQELQRRWQQSR